MPEQRPKLETLLESADESRPESVLEFYQELLVADVIVPKSPVAIPLQLGAIDAYGFMIAGGSEHPILPVFTSEERLREWGGEDLQFDRLSFIAIARVAPTQMVVHLNPGANIGKEFNGWELGKLSLGGQALEELLFEICEETQESSLVDSTELPPEFREVVPRWQGIFEAYDSVLSAYCAVVGSPSGDSELILVGYEAPEMPEEIRGRLETEIRFSVPNEQGFRVLYLEPASTDPLANLVRQAELFYSRRTAAEEESSKEE